MNTEMTTVKDGILDLAIETMKADIRTIVASPLVEVEEVVIKVNTGLTTVLLIIDRTRYELFENFIFQCGTRRLQFVFENILFKRKSPQHGT